MVMLKNVKSSSEIFYLHLRDFFMLIAFVYLYQQAGSFLLEDLYKLNLSAQNNCGYS
jgi:hypothetical protein